TVSHQMKAVEPIVNGRYLQAETQQQALAAASALPMPTPAAAIPAQADA
ncbi:MAG: NAD(P)H-quinone oxidoreductase subunit K, partial [Synechococcaceae cyanobacterium]|nr:NAD(P)H-quinone oxidoreductase subunit K [Synechococcaceae cyanobacterium]